MSFHKMLPYLEILTDDKTKLDMSRWSSLPLSLVGHINLLKVVLLPKFLSFSTYSNLHLAMCNVCNVDGILRSFIWGNNPACLKKSVLQLSPALSQLQSLQGVLALPTVLLGL